MPIEKITIRLWSGEGCVVYSDCSKATLRGDVGLVTFFANNGKIRVESTLPCSIERVVENA